MAYLNITMRELLTMLEKNSEYNRDRIRNIRIVNDNQVELTISVGQFFPDIKVTVLYNRFENGRMFFNVLSSGGIKMLMGLLAEMGGKKLNQYITMEKNSVEVDMNKLLSDNLQGVTIRDMSIMGEQIYVTVGIK